MGMIGNSLAQGLISGANIQDGTVDTPDIKDSAVTAAKIASGVVTPAKMDFSAGTANGVLYLNGSKVASSGSGLVFDGTNLGIGISSPTYPLDVVGAQIRVASASSLGTRMTFTSTSTNERSYQIGSNFSIGSGEFAIYDVAAASNRFVIDSNGSVGIGTNSPGQKLDIAGNARVTSSLNPNLILNTTASANHKSEIIFTKSGTAKYAIGVDINATGDNNFYVYDAPNNAERMRIDSSGNLLVGTQTTISGNRNNFVGSSPGQLLFRHTGQSSGRHWYMGVESGNDVFIIYPDLAGGVYLTRGATGWTGNSDERIKTELTPFVDAAAKVCSLRAGTGRFLVDDENVSRSFLIAQDVQAVLPEAVDVKDDEIGTLGLRYTDVIPLLTAAIQEQQAIIDSLTTRITALETP